MLEYYVIQVNDGFVEGLERRLNILAEEGWRVSCSVQSMVILEREKVPAIDEQNNDDARVITYVYPHYTKKPSN